MKLELNKVAKTVGAETHLYDMSLEFGSGLNVLLGPTLAGKTSLMRIMAGLDKPTTGQILIDGQDVSGLDVRKRSVAFVYQQFINYPSMNVYDNIASPLKLQGLNRAEVKQKVHEVAELMHLETMLERLPAELSGGQQQRTAMARALVKEADLLLLDEPLVNLDYKLREELRAEMREIFERRDAVIVYATTEPFEALQLGGRTAVLDEGRLLQTGETLEVYHQPTTQRVAQVFSDPPMNIVPVTLQGERLNVSGEMGLERPPHLSHLSDGPYQLGVRPPHLSLAAEAGTSLEIPVSVELAEIMGSETFLHLNYQSQDQDAETSFRLVSELSGVHNYARGDALTLHVNAKRLFVFEPSGALAAAPRGKGAAHKEVAHG